MTDHLIEGYKSFPINIFADGDRWIFTRDSFVSPEDNDGSTINGQNNKLLVRGTIDGSGDNRGIVVADRENSVRVFDTGYVIGYAGIYGQSADLNVVNDGNIYGRVYGIATLGVEAVIHNSARIVSGFVGISSESAGLLVVNEAKGKILGQQSGIELLQGAGETARVENHGLIKGDVYGIVGTLGDDAIINAGVIKGEISLGSGDDTFDNRGGKIDFAVHGGAGDDTMIVSGDKYGLIEESGEGFDTVKSVGTRTLGANVEKLVLIGNGNIDGTGTDVSNVLIGNAGNNKLFGLAGVDILKGGKGDDRLIGGVDPDVFEFRTGDGHDTVMDFGNGADVFDLQDWTAISSFSDLMNNHVSTSNGDVIISAGGDQLVLKDTVKADLELNDFVI